MTTAQRRPSQERLAITPVTVVDVNDGTLRADQTVLVEGDRIATVGPADEVAVPDGTTMVDGTGGYLIPGLWDMHVHAFNSQEWAEAFSPLFLANGVTGVRGTWHYREVAEAAEAAIEAGEMAGPARIVIAGNLIDGPARIWPNSLVAYTPEQGRRLVDSLHAAGAPFIKVYSSLTPETYLAIAERARALGVPFVGHVPTRGRDFRPTEPPPSPFSLRRGWRQTRSPPRSSCWDRRPAAGLLDGCPASRRCGSGIRGRSRSPRAT